MSTYLNRKSLVGCLFAVGLLGGLSSTVLAGENGSDHSPTIPATATDKPATMANDSKPDHGSMDHSKMSHESMDHDQKTKKAD
ncbi:MULTISPECIES: hypothetical protein [unclassified Pseudomonas]|uniref:hypothetical protein n=1 Tax=Pseudomonas TaxID=286 RepID=UPI0015AB30D1|nr:MULTISPECIES: hypothetical protein [unclassified Pseudomonas]